MYYLPHQKTNSGWNAPVAFNVQHLTGFQWCIHVVRRGNIALKVTQWLQTVQVILKDAKQLLNHVWNKSKNMHHKLYRQCQSEREKKCIIKNAAF